MNIKEASKLTELTSNTIRYYERIGVIPAIPRDKNGNRVFNDLEIQWLDLSRDLRHAGVHVETIIDYVQLVAQGESKIPARINLLEETKAEIESSVAELNATLEHLQYKIDNYDTHMVNLETNLLKRNEEK